MYEQELNAQWQFPELSAQSNTYFIEREKQDELRQLIQSQYMYLESLGNDYIHDNPIYDETLIELLEFVHENYVSIVNFEIVMDSPSEVQVIGRLTYNFVCVDLINTILPKCMIILGVHDPERLCTINISEFQQAVARILKYKIDTISEMNTQVSSLPLRNEQIKYAYYMDLIDNDITSLFERLISPIVRKYEVTLFSKSGV